MLEKIENYLTDLRSVIGLFLTTIGVIVLLSYFFGPSDDVGGIHVNLLGGACLLITGLVMVISRYVAKSS